MIAKCAHSLVRRNLFFLTNPATTRLKEYQEKRVVGYTAEEMFAVAATVAEYPEFVPWCRAVDVKEHSQNLYTAHVQIGFPPVYETYTARVTTVRPKIVHVSCPFCCCFLYAEKLNNGCFDSDKSVIIVRMIL
ncbi:unnamed protein product [Gongylonema pulchrum]|uniref:Polyketide_cyc domain-containing protein n=1 Tax=Gongylonema pulchrum TaxID=637853 RepID=A0A183DCI2_9BILA|nr:unnamed protein product [Gongylonema pulchrum]